MADVLQMQNVCKIGVSVFLKKLSVMASAVILFISFLVAELHDNSKLYVKTGFDSNGRLNSAYSCTCPRIPTRARICPYVPAYAHMCPH